MSKKIAFVDVDNTLWDFESEMRSRMAELLDVEIPTEFNEWNMPVQMFEDKQVAYKMFNDIHMEQEQFEPFEFTNLVLKDLKRLNYHILIATNRIPESKQSLVNWLDSNDLPYDEIWCDLNKETLLDNRDIELVIDDAPFIIEKAVDKFIKTVSLRYPYNQNTRGSNKFNNMKQMHEYFINELFY